MSKAPPPVHPTWAGVVKGQPPPAASPGPSPPAARLLQLYRDCVARRTWARLCFETTGGEEELSFLCRVGGAATSTATKGSSKKQGPQLTRGGGNGQGGEERPGWKEGEGQQWKEQQQPTQQREPPAIQEQQLPAGGATIGAAAVSRSSSRRQEKQPSAEVAALGRSSSPQQLTVGSAA